MFLEFYSTSGAQLTYNPYTITEHSDRGLANTKAKLQSTKVAKNRPWKREMDLMGCHRKVWNSLIRDKRNGGRIFKVENHGIIRKIKVFEYPESEIRHKIHRLAARVLPNSCLLTIWTKVLDIQKLGSSGDQVVAYFIDFLSLLEDESWKQSHIFVTGIHLQ